jgi:hypothetical protein
MYVQVEASSLSFFPLLILSSMAEVQVQCEVLYKWVKVEQTNAPTPH